MADNQPTVAGALQGARSLLQHAERVASVLPRASDIAHAEGQQHNTGLPPGIPPLPGLDPKHRIRTDGSADGYYPGCRIGGATNNSNYWREAQVSAAVVVGLTNLRLQQQPPALQQRL
jgi:hypothetical protein